MIVNAIAFLVGVSVYQFMPVLIAPVWLVLIFPLLACLMFLPRLRWFWLCCAGFIWSHLFAVLYFQHVPDEEIAGQDIQVTGVISDIPVLQPDVSRFELDIEAFTLPGYKGAIPEHIRLSWYRNHRQLRAGERWRLTIRLKPPHGFQNPGGFDYEAWLYQKGLHATGYVRKNQQNQRLKELVPAYGLQRLRHLIQIRLADLDQQADNATNSVDGLSNGLLSALAVGYRGDIDQLRWQSFIKTGTSHLMAISGLHIGLIAAIAYWLARRVYPYRLQLKLQPVHFAVVVSLCCAIFYAALAGFTVPTQRALIMLSIVYGALLFSRQLSPAYSLSVALMVVLLWSPLAVLSAGFWFSFMAVATIAFVTSGRINLSGSSSLWRVQLAVVLILLPVGIFLFQQGSLVAPLANLWAIPWVASLVVPLLLLGLCLLPVSEQLATAVLQLSRYLFEECLQVLDVLADSSFAIFHLPQPALWIVVLSLTGLVLLFSPVSPVLRGLSLVIIMPLFSSSRAGQEQGGFEFSLLDTGQGLASVVRTANHTLLFDSGARFSDRFDVGERVILPYLRHQGINKLDRLVISNGDRDHIGGAASVLSGIAVGDVLGRDIESLKHPDKTLCQRGQQWQWDGVQFEILHPQHQDYRKRNNYSCVLRVSNQSGSVLISADIEKKAEKELLKRQADKLASSVLVVPHHGSRTSSTRAFVKQVAPSYAVYSTGYLNRYRFPRPQVRAVYDDLGIIQYNTAFTGMLRFTFQPDQQQPEVIKYRQLKKRYWHQF